MIILQGSHIADVVNRLVKMGYPRELINFA